MVLPPEGEIMVALLPEAAAALHAAGGCPAAASHADNPHAAQSLAAAAR